MDHSTHRTFYPRPDETIVELSARALRALVSAGLEPKEAARDIRALLAAACGWSTAMLLARENERIGGPAASLFAAHLGRRQAREPVSKILGSRAFWKDEFHVSSAVLDPRADTELIVFLASAAFAPRVREPLRILDLGTGSGALLCSLLREFPLASGLGLDISGPACDVARRNVDDLGLAARARIENRSWDALEDGKWDIVVSNPPYIARGVIDSLEPEVRDWDPVLALDGGADGLDAYRSLARLLPRLLCSQGLAFLEIGFDQGVSAGKIVESGGLKMIAVRTDLEGQARVLEVGH